MALIVRTLHLGPLDNNTYVLSCPQTREAAVIDAGFEPERVVEALRADGLAVRWLLATHAHYDHVCGMRGVQEAVGGSFALHPLDRPLLDLLSQQGAMFGFPPAVAPDEVSDLADGQVVAIGRETVAVLHTPGHSPGHVTFRHGDGLWSGDVLFAGSIGRTDLPGGSFEQLARSIRERLFALGDHLKVYPGHGPLTTIGRERAHNPFVGDPAGFA
jgi:glyoxylase-like metal-dependent hydrolase (beta-lactamase superfamily II)